MVGEGVVDSDFGSAKGSPMGVDDEAGSKVGLCVGFARGALVSLVGGGDGRLDGLALGPRVGDVVGSDVSVGPIVE